MLMMAGLSNWLTRHPLVFILYPNMITFILWKNTFSLHLSYLIYKHKVQRKHLHHYVTLYLHAYEPQLHGQKCLFVYLLYFCFLFRLYLSRKWVEFIYAFCFTLHLKQVSIDLHIKYQWLYHTTSLPKGTMFILEIELLCKEHTCSLSCNLSSLGKKSLT